MQGNAAGGGAVPVGAMSPINKQLAIFLVLFFALGIGWFHLVLFVLSLFAR